MNRRTLRGLALGACLTLAAAAATQASPGGNPRTCFPAARWAPAPDRVRPCVRIVRLYEDGSFRAAVSDADGTVRYTVGVGALDR